MSEAKGKKDGNAGAPNADSPQATTTSDPGAARLAVRLVPAGNTDQPVLANYTTLNIAPGMAFVDFGFIEPGVLAAIPRVAKRGGKLPETINGKLAVRVAMSYDTLAVLHRQIGQLVTTVGRKRATPEK